MATKAERFALFKDQTKKCLDQMEAQRIKDALGAFLKSKVPSGLPYPHLSLRFPFPA